MSASLDVSVQVDFSRIRENAERIARLAGVPLIAVVKADAYGLGAKDVAATLADLVDAFYVFDAREAVEHHLYATTGKRTIALRGTSNDSKDYLAHHIQPAVWSLERAAQLKAARPVLSVDSGQQRFGCPLADVESFLNTTGIEEAFTHAVTIAQAAAFGEATETRARFRHAAGSALLGDAAALFDAVRPGLGLYVGATRVSARLIETHESNRPSGYTGFITPRHGVIQCGYSNGLRKGPCVINGTRRRILEVGMQSAFVEIGSADRIGDEVILLGEGLTEIDVAMEWGTTPHEALLRLATCGVRLK